MDTTFFCQVFMTSHTIPYQENDVLTTCATKGSSRLYLNKTRNLTNTFRVQDYLENGLKFYCLQVLHQVGLKWRLHFVHVPRLRLRGHAQLPLRLAHRKYVCIHSSKHTFFHTQGCRIFEITTSNNFFINLFFLAGHN